MLLYCILFWLSVSTCVFAESQTQPLRETDLDRIEGGGVQGEQVKEFDQRRRLKGKGFKSRRLYDGKGKGGKKSKKSKKGSKSGKGKGKKGGGHFDINNCASYASTWYVV